MKTVRTLAFVLAGLFSSMAAQAATLSNTGFESGLSPWLTIGTVLNPGSVTLTGGATIAPTGGSGQAELGSNSGVGRFSVLNFISGLTDIGDLNEFASLSGLTSFENGSVDPQTGDLEGENFTSGSAIKQDNIDITAGMTMSFDFAFATLEATQFFGPLLQGVTPPEPDAAFLFADGAFHLLAKADDFAQPAFGFGQELSDGYAAFDYTFQNSGPQTIALVMLNYDNSFAASRLFADSIEFAAVPVPAALPLFVAGLVGLGWVGRRRRAA